MRFRRASCDSIRVLLKLEESLRWDESVGGLESIDTSYREGRARYVRPIITKQPYHISCISTILTSPHLLLPILDFTRLFQLFKASTVAVYGALLPFYRYSRTMEARKVGIGITYPKSRPARQTILEECLGPGRDKALTRNFHAPLTDNGSLT